MIDEATWNAMKPEQQAAAWLAELSGMLQTAISEWRESLKAGNSGTVVAAGAFNVAVGRRAR